MNRKSKILTLIVSYNANKWIDSCLKSVLTSTVKTDIIIIDNASEDDTCEIIQKKYPDVVLIKNNRNLGFGQANNIGLNYALDNDYAYVLLLNQDAQISPDMLMHLLNVSENRREFAILSPIHLNGKRNNFDQRFYYYLISGCPQFITDMSLKNKVSPVYHCGFVNAAIWFMTKKCIIKAGGFDPLFFHTGEDLDYYFRIRAKGLNIGICPEVYAYHGREDRESSPFDNYFTNRKNDLLINLKNKSSKYKFRNAIVEVLFDSLINLLRGDIKDYLSDWRIGFYLLFNYRKIKLSRNESLKEKAYL